MASRRESSYLTLHIKDKVRNGNTENTTPSYQPWLAYLSCTMQCKWYNKNYFSWHFCYPQWVSGVKSLVKISTPCKILLVNCLANKMNVFWYIISSYDLAGFYKPRKISLINLGMTLVKKKVSSKWNNQSVSNQSSFCVLEYFVFLKMNKLRSQTDLKFCRFFSPRRFGVFFKICPCQIVARQLQSPSSQPLTLPCCSLSGIIFPLTILFCSIVLLY